MGKVGGKSDEEYSVIGDKGDIGFLDFENDKSLCSYNPNEESQIVSISVPFPLVEGKPQWGFVGDTIVDSITIENTTTDSLDLWSVSIYDSKPDESFTLSIMKPPSADSEERYIKEFMESFSLEDRVLRPGQTLTIWLSCKPKEIGLHTSAVHFTVGDETIERLVFVLAEDKISQSLTPDKPYYKPRKKKHPVSNVPADTYVQGSRPSKPSNRSFKYRLPAYHIPADIRSLVENEQIPEAISGGLTEENYVSYFKTLLVMEEIKLEEDMRDYDMERVTMKNIGSHFLSLEVPGLAERRPSLVYGDYVLARLPSNGTGNTISYQGYIHRVQAEEVYLKFNKEFHLSHKDSNLYSVQFTYNRVGIRRIYQAVEAAESLGTELLFPYESSGKRSIQPTRLAPISTMLNEEQVSAVEMILACRGGSPYVIHGPPGTGKTMTLVEAILQLFTKHRPLPILVCAPSNSAADHVLEKLLNEKAVAVNGKEAFRLNAITRPYEDVSPDLLEYCYVEDFTFKCPPLKDLRRFRVIISTYTSASLLYAEGVERGHFSHIFLDEAGQASEPETMVPLSHLCQRNTVVVLAGDPMQLGPIVFSKDAEGFGLGKSFLERLFECSLYGEGNENYITKLVRNYRSHPAILHLPSQLFYEGELVSCKESDTISNMKWMDILPNKDFPMVFIGVQGCDEREGSNPSWFNRIEASKVVEIIKNLIQDKGMSEKDIGVITPYKQQVHKIRKALEIFDSSEIKVGSVEQFQGQERNIIIISTVRSTIKHNEFDKVHYLGFLSNPRRFNVAISRARSLLIVIGNPHIICKDPFWNNLLWYCYDNDSYKGCFLPDRQETIEEEAAQEYYLENGGENNLYPQEYYMENGGENNLYTQEHYLENGGENNLYAQDQYLENGNENNEWPPEEANRGHDPYQRADLPAPVMDEAQWSDGWK